MNNLDSRSSKARDHVLTIKKLTGHNIIKRAAMHNLREIPIELSRGDRIDASRTNRNQILVGSSRSSAIKGDYEKLIEAANLPTRIRRDAVMAIEVVISLPKGHGIDELKFFGDCAEWCKSYFGVPILSLVIHRDEANPHCHILLVPLVRGRLQGSRLFGSRSKLRGMQEHFYEHVAAHYGFNKPRPMVRYPSEFRRNIATQVIDTLIANAEYLHDEQVQAELIQVVSNDPLDLARMVGIRV